MKILLARIGFMKFYQGPKPGDEKPIGGGSYNDEKIGFEAYNFLNIDGTLYGYFQPHMKEPYEINLARIEPGYKGEKIENVLVIFFATNPISKGQVVVGWYKNATVYRSFQNPDTLFQRNNYSYNLEAKENDYVLLPISNRKFLIGHNIEGVKEGNPGQANAFYVFENNGKLKDLENPKNSWIKKLIEYIKNYNGLKIKSIEDEIQENIITSEYSSGGQGFQSDIETRLKIESYSMSVCYDYYSKKGYEVKDVSSNQPYDFIISKNGISQYVEVKGTQTPGESIILTKNEVSLSQAEGHRMILFILHSIVMNKKTVKKNSGTIFIIDPWKIKNENLTPISFNYKIS